MKQPWRGLGAIAEVSLAFALMHVAFRAFKRFTLLGQAENRSGLNFSPGIAMILVALAFIAARRRGLASYGLTPRPFLPGVAAALLCLLALGACAALALGAGAPFERPPVSAAGAAGPLAVNLAATILLLSALQRLEPAFERAPRWLGPLALALVPVFFVAIASAREEPLGPAVLTMLWLLAGAGVGEEVFFRGYVQSRLNESLGRPWRIFGVAFGPGLFGAALFFGLVHALNRVDYFSGVYSFLWWHALVTASTLFYGFLRERHGSVLAPAIVHGFSDLLVRMLWRGHE
jgi:membrane protease YdiL (CAAX protease family)